MLTPGSNGRAPVGPYRGGDGDPLVLIPGGWEDARAWEGLLPTLTTGFDVLAFDRREQDTDRAARPPALQAAVQELASLLESTGHFPAHLAAQDSGAAVAARLALEHPELVRSIVLHEPIDLALAGSLSGLEAEGRDGRSALDGAVRLALAGEVEGAAREYLREFGSQAEQWERFPHAARARWLANGARWARETREALESRSSRDTAAGLSELALPVFLSVGAESPERTRRLVDGWADTVANVRREVLPGAGHLPHLFAPSTLVGAWAKFLIERHVPPT